MKTFFDITSCIATVLKLKEANDITNIKRWVNSAYLDFQNKWHWDWRLKKASMQIIPFYTTGTVVATLDSRTVTGTDTVWTSAMVDRYIQINNDNNYYRIVSVTNGTEMLLDLPFGEATVSGVGYKIWKKNYPLIPDVKELIDLRSGDLRYTIEYKEDLQVSPFEEGTPMHYKNSDNTEVPTTASYTSCVSCAKNSNLVTGVGTTFLTDLQEGDNFYFNTVEDKTQQYTVLKIISETQLYLVQSALSDFISTSAYIFRNNQKQIEFNSSPTKNININYRYFKRAYNMINDNDEPEMPEEYRDVLYYGAVIYAMQNLLRDTKQVGIESGSKRLYDIRVQEIKSIENSKGNKPDGWKFGGYN